MIHEKSTVLIGTSLIVLQKSLRCIVKEEIEEAIKGLIFAKNNIEECIRYLQLHEKKLNNDNN